MICCTLSWQRCVGLSELPTLCLSKADGHRWLHCPSLRVTSRWWTLRLLCPRPQQGRVQGQSGTHQCSVIVYLKLVRLPNLTLPRNLVLSLKTVTTVSQMMSCQVNRSRMWVAIWRLTMRWNISGWRHALWRRPHGSHDPGRGIPGWHR